jgi:hypothetical protein
MRDQNEKTELTELGAASELTLGYYAPEFLEAFVILDFYDMP